MESAVEQLHFYFVEEPKLDCFPQETAEFERLFEHASTSLSDAKDRLVNNASITGFWEGLRLGLLLGTECSFPPRPLP